MNIDDPNKPEFASWRSYGKFAQRVRHRHRYVWGKEVHAFLDTVLATSKDRHENIPEGTILFRAQRGVKFNRPVDDQGNALKVEVLALDRKRMKPPKNHAREGRVNPVGIPVLYLAFSEQTAISEVRPWIGTEVSVAKFKIVRELIAVDLSLGHGTMSFSHLTLDQLAGKRAPGIEEKEKAVWVDIDKAFSRPIDSSRRSIDYVPMQILAECFRNAGYDAVVYRSRFGGNEGYNLLSLILMMQRSSHQFRIA